MASQERLLCTSHEDNIQFYQSSNATSAKFSCVYGQLLLSRSSKCVELEGLKRDDDDDDDDMLN